MMMDRSSTIAVPIVRLFYCCTLNRAPFSHALFRVFFSSTLVLREWDGSDCKVTSRPHSPTFLSIAQHKNVIVLTH